MSIVKIGLISISLVTGLLAAIPVRAQVRTVNEVPGKEYSDSLDIDENGVLSPEQTLLWDGTGNVKNGFNYGGSEQVNAMANIGDAHFFDVILNKADLLFSTSGDVPAPIMFESTGGGGGIWATQPQINKNGVQELDGLEVWGPDEVPDANRYSLVGDKVLDATGRRIAVHNDVSLGVPFRDSAFYVDELAAAIGLPQNLWNQFDLDGLMTHENDILFSIAPIDGVFDGGEIWTWKKGDVAANFLNHGGHLWDTAFDVKATFGTASENVDALEAVGAGCPPNEPCQPMPEPNSIAGLLGLSVLTAGSVLKDKLKKQRSIG